WRDANQSVDASLRSQESISVRTANLDHRALDARLFSLALVEDFHFVTFALRPPHVHAKKHFSPVLGLGSAGASAYLDLRIAEIILAAKQSLHLERIELAVERLELTIELRIHFRIRRFAQQLIELARALQTSGQFVVWIEPPAKCFHFLQNLLRRFLSIPEISFGHAGFVRRQLLALSLDVK